ncbi:hypothetical protein HKK70_09020 [Bacillus safensis]|uniref:hypothetical protein n=1 Tax=Bacillus safensis TaxID=561879 RepID=UPI00146F6A48|nr:hypothetical protein [Bacillus safensis]MCM3365966.1 hypothetical protein [Bacillus safensis]NMW01906.1 hypothetical protein [Bacillus safensis]
MNITVDPNLKRFSLNFKNHWKQAVGHEVLVGGYSFCVTPIDDTLKVSEVTTGALVMDLPLPKMYITKNESMKILEQVGKQVLEQLQNSKNPTMAFKQMQQQSYALLGSTPPPEPFSFEGDGVVEYFE